MRIISKFYDYYDCIMRQGIDKETVYIRREERDEPVVHVPYIDTGRCDDSAEFFAVGFCGEVHWGLAVRIYQGWGKGSLKDFIYGKEAIIKWLKDRNITFPWRFDFRIPKIDWKHPTFVCHRYDCRTRMVWNHSLDEFGFQKVKDPFTAYQELYQWVAAQARPENGMIETSDEDRLIAHGFDKKFSFRKASSK